MQEKFLTVDVEIRNLILFKIGMRLFEIYRVTIFINFLLLIFLLFFPFLFCQRAFSRNLNEFKHISKNFGSLPKLKIIFKVNYEFNNLFFSFGSISCLINKIYQNEFIHWTVIGISSTIDFGSMFDPLIINVKHSIFELKPRNQIKSFNKTWVLF